MHLYLMHYVTNELLAASRDVDGLSLLAPAQERNAARRTICLCRVGAGRDNADEVDRHPLTSHRNRGDLRKA